QHLRQQSDIRRVRSTDETDSQWEQALEEVNLVSQTELHPVVGDGCFYTALGSHCAKFCPELALVTCDDFRAAMGDDGSRHVLFRAPHQLRADRCMAD